MLQTFQTGSLNMAAALPSREGVTSLRLGIPCEAWTQNDRQLQQGRLGQKEPKKRPRRLLGMPPHRANRWNATGCVLTGNENREPRLRSPSDRESCDEVPISTDPAFPKLIGATRHEAHINVHVRTRACNTETQYLSIQIMHFPQPRRLSRTPWTSQTGEKFLASPGRRRKMP